jgi:hypothetical protein
MPDVLVLVQDCLTIACAGFNAAYFATRWLGTGAPRTELLQRR